VASAVSGGASSLTAQCRYPGQPRLRCPPAVAEPRRQREVTGPLAAPEASFSFLLFPGSSPKISHSDVFLLDTSAKNTGISPGASGPLLANRSGVPVRWIARTERVSRVWSLTSDQRTITCALEQHNEPPFAVTVRIDGAQIAARTCATKAEAVGYAAFLFDRLTESGWVVRIPMRESVSH